MLLSYFRANICGYGEQRVAEWFKALAFTDH